MRIAVIIPVSPFEPERTVRRSAEHFSKLAERKNLRVCYVLDDERMGDILREFPVEVIIRGTSRGKRAGALNDALKVVEEDFVAIFDVDCVVGEDFFDKALEALQKDGKIAIASGCRRVLNEKSSLVTRIVSSEYHFFCDIFRLMNHFGGFLHFNGLIGLLRTSALRDKSFNEQVLCEDVEMMNRLFLEGFRARLIASPIREEAPLTLADLINQRIRWSAGAVESLRFFSLKILRAPFPLSFKLSWFATMLSPFYSFLLSFLVPLYSWRLLQISESWKDFLIRFFGLFFYGWIISFCAFSALLKKISGRRIEWRALKRS
ncbi:MAG: hypothetical protein PWR13_661 [Archaeoglobi archaeon]|nr:hypothetical protein [Archaeoglobi archaeon]MDK2781633.1 hypothetical protein [Archaeoglobi archaeon]